MNTAPGPVHPHVVTAARAYLRVYYRAQVWTALLAIGILGNLFLIVAAFLIAGFDAPLWIYAITPVFVAGYVVTAFRRSRRLNELFTARNEHDGPPFPPVGTHPYRWALRIVDNATAPTHD